MATVPQKTLIWLYNVLSREYRDPNRTYSDLAQLLAQYPSFSPRTDVYTYENGASALLVHLLGTIPVSFRGQSYRFPIALWIPHAYPYEAPLIYVTPTEDMVMRPGQHVDGGGKVYHHYLAHWRDQWDRSNPVELLSILSDTFAKEPPLISKQQTMNIRPDRQLLQQQAPAVPPLPDGLRREPSRAVSGDYGYGSPAAPPPPPKETSSTSIPSQILPQSPRTNRYDAPPPLPSKESGSSSTQRTQFPRMNGASATPSASAQYLPQRNSSLRHSVTSQQQMYQQPNSGVLQHQNQQARILPTMQSGYDNPLQSSPLHSGLSQRPLSQDPSAFQQYPLQPIRPAPYQSLPPNQHHHQQQHQRQAPKKPPPIDLLDSPFDISLPVTSNLPAPPVPRNPEKEALLSTLSDILTHTLHSSIAQNTSALPSLQAQHTALAATYQTLTSELQTLDALTQTLQSNNTILTTSLNSANKTIASAHSRSKRGELPKVDDMLVAPTVVGKQLYDVICEERGIEAGIWALQEGFVKGRIGSEVWARKMRELSREGFRKKVLASKIAAGMGLEV